MKRRGTAPGVPPTTDAGEKTATDAADPNREMARQAFEQIKANRERAGKKRDAGAPMTDLHSRIVSLVGEARSASEQVADETRDGGKAAMAELHQIGRKAAEAVTDAEVTTAKHLKLIE